jgi:hypothetical protein
VTDGQQKVNDENVDNNGGDEKVWEKHKEKRITIHLIEVTYE